MQNNSMRSFRLLMFSSCVLLYSSAFSQNSLPVVSNLSALADTILHKLTITFDVSDGENDAMEIFLAASFNDGSTFALNTENATGDVGYPEMTGTLKRIEWYYPDSLSQLLSNFKVKVVADDRQVLSIQQIIAQIDSNLMKQNLQFIEGIRHRTAGAAHLQEVRDSIVSRFQQHGLESRLHEFQYNPNYTGQNIIGRKQGFVYDTRTFIVDGHYDTVDDSPGADDNGSSIAGILEILRAISSLQLKNTVEFIAFDLEESGLAGSQAFVPDGISNNEDIAGVINMDMIGYFSNQPNSQTVPPGFDLVFPELYAELVANNFRANFIISTANDNSESLLLLFDSMATRYVPSLTVGAIQVPGNGELISDSRRSDHVAFWDAGYKALHLSDGAETRNPNYHSPADTFGTVNFTFARNITMAVTAMLLQLAHPIHAGEATAYATPDPASTVFEIAEECRIVIAPNPVNINFKISLPDCANGPLTVKIFSLEGKIIYKSILPKGNEVDLDFNDFIAPGYYILEVSYFKISHSRKILIN